MTDLAITARCWQDLEELAERFSPDAAEHVIDVFVARRGRRPVGLELSRRIASRFR